MALRHTILLRSKEKDGGKKQRGKGKKQREKGSGKKGSEGGKGIIKENHTKPPSDSLPLCQLYS